MQRKLDNRLNHCHPVCLVCLQVSGSRQGIDHTAMIRELFYAIIYYRTGILPRLWVRGNVTIIGVALCKIEFEKQLQSVKW